MFEIKRKSISQFYANLNTTLEFNLTFDSENNYFAIELHYDQGSINPLKISSYYNN